MREIAKKVATVCAGIPKLCKVFKFTLEVQGLQIQWIFEAEQWSYLHTLGTPTNAHTLQLQNTQKLSKKIYISTSTTYIMECISIPSLPNSSRSDGSRLAFSERRPNVEPPSLKSYISFTGQKEGTIKRNKCAKNC